MKRVFSICLTFALFFSLVACSSTPSSNGGGTGSSPDADRPGGGIISSLLGGDKSKDDHALSDNANIGDVVTFGVYEQDANPTNGPEPIEWIVLDKDGESVLLLSKYVLDIRGDGPVDSSFVKWSGCPARSGLNQDFFLNAFTNDEQLKIQWTYNKTPNNEETGIWGGFETWDKVFVLSKEEFEKYRMVDGVEQSHVSLSAFGHGVNRPHWMSSEWEPQDDESTVVAMKKDGTFEYFSNAHAWDNSNNYNWSLRTPGADDQSFMSVCGDRLVTESMTSFGSGIRPAMWVNTGVTAQYGVIGNVGDSFYFGHDVQVNYDNRSAFDVIEWLILDIEEDRALVVSKEGLLITPAKVTINNVLLSVELLRNLPFLCSENFLLSEYERNRAEEVENGQYFFLLTEDQVLNYFPTPESRLLKISHEAYRNGSLDGYMIFREEPDDNFRWWLGKETGQREYSIVGLDGEISREYSEYTFAAIRPAMWVDINYQAEEDAGKSPDTQKPVALKGATAGDTVLFGKYEQNTVNTGKAEDIEWIVLDREGDELLLLSKYCLDVHIGDWQKEVTGWEDSDIREWLNGSFYDKAFSSSEKGQIKTSTLTTENYIDANNGIGSREYEISGYENDTADNVFLLSCQEVEAYIPDLEARITRPTPYAIAQGSVLDYEGFDCSWLLRSMDGTFHHAWRNVSHYFPEGELESESESLDGVTNIRPAIRVRAG